MPAPTLSGTLFELIFRDAEDSVFGVIDGASAPGLLPALRRAGVQHCCLYSGELAPDLAAAAPHLVLLTPDDQFTQRFLTEGWGRHWGIVATAREDLRAMRKHFRTFLTVKGPSGKRLYFRYYDPRVLRTFLPTCDAGQLGMVFGPVRRYVCEGTQGATGNEYRIEKGKLQTAAFGGG